MSPATIALYESKSASMRRIEQASRDRQANYESLLPTPGNLQRIEDERLLRLMVVSERRDIEECLARRKEVAA